MGGDNQEFVHPSLVNDWVQINSPTQTYSYLALLGIKEGHCSLTCSGVYMFAIPQRKCNYTCLFKV